MSDVMFESLEAHCAAMELWGYRPSGFDSTERLDHFVDMLPPRWREAWRMRVSGYTHREIAKVMDVSQPSIYFALTRARNALKLLLRLPQISEESIEADLSRHLEPRVVEALKLFYRTSNFSSTAKAMGYPNWYAQSNNVKALVLKALKKLRRVPTAHQYVTFFTALVANPRAWSHAPKAVVT